MIVGISRKFSGGGSFTPLDLPNLWAWYDASQESYSDHDNTTVWHDFSGNARDFPRYPAQGAEYRTNQLNGKAVFHFSGTNDVMQYGSSISWSDPATIVVVGQVGAGVSHTSFQSFVSQTHGIWGSGDSAGFFEIYGGSHLHGPAQDDAVWHKFYGMFQSGSNNSNFYADGTKYNGTAGAMSNGQLWIGYSDFGGPLAGDIAEVILIMGDIGDTDAAQLDAYYTAKYGV